MSFLAGCASVDQDVHFQFTDSGCYENIEGNSKPSYKSTWADGFQNVQIRTEINCAFIAQKPSFKLSDETLDLEFETLSPEGAVALCDCRHKIDFKVKTEKEYPVQIKMDGIDLKKYAAKY